MKDVLAVQHAHWIADRLLRAIGPHAFAREHTCTAVETTDAPQPTSRRNAASKAPVKSSGVRSKTQRKQKEGPKASFA